MKKLSFRLLAETVKTKRKEKGLTQIDLALYDRPAGKYDLQALH